MTLAHLLDLCSPDRIVVPTSDEWKSWSIDDLAFDSRQAGPGTVFFALPGTHTDGHRFLEDVAARGCRAVVVSHLPDAPRTDTVYAVVVDPRFALSPWSAALWGHPSRELFVVGVTGTDGKSSTVSFLHQLLTLAGHKAGFFSTVEWNDGTVTRHNEGRQSTPEAPQVQAVLRRMVEARCRFGVIEATSHGLSPKTNRLGDVEWAGAVFTNVTLEHLEFHGTVEAYRADKARLFSALPRGRKGAWGVVNLDDPHHTLFQSAAQSSPVFTYSLSNPSADLFVRRLEEHADGLNLELVFRQRSVATQLAIPGRFNASNLCAAVLGAAAALSQAGYESDPLQLAPLAAKLLPVKGRMAPVREGQPFAVLVDYAHTPGAFEALLPAVKAVTPGRVIVVFGSGGERDRAKRPLQGALADRWADLIVLTDEDPRLEDPDQILADIASGVKTKPLGQALWQVRPRRAALEHAFSLARAGDTVLLLGKGHERTLVTGGGPQPWDEDAVARELLVTLKQGRV